MSHDLKEDISTWRLFITMVLNLLITVFEIVGGLLSGSLSLISDALHNLTDALSVIVSYIAIKLSNYERTENYTFGLKRAQTLAAVLNTAVLVVISIYLMIEAYARFIKPEQIKGLIMIIVASIGLVANVVGTLLLHKDSKGNMNIRSTYLHLLSDVVTSIGVIIGGIAIVLFNIYWIDPLLTVLISLYILKESSTIIKEAVQVLMMGKPKNISIEDIKKDIEKIPNIENIHHVHVWMLTENLIHFEAHVDTCNTSVKQCSSLIEKIKKKLEKDYGICHVTLQFEENTCESKALLEQKT